MRKGAQKKKGVVIVPWSLEIPPMPIVALRIIQALDNSHSAVWQLEQVITMDQSITSRLLKMANSAYYSKGREIDSVSDAILRIGYDTVRSMVVMASLSGLRKPNCAVDCRLWEHSLAVGVSATVVAHNLGFERSSDFLIPALLHDIGKVIMNRNTVETYSRAMQLMDKEHKASIEAERKFFNYDHTEVGAYVATEWRLPDNLVEIIKLHHCEDTAAVCGTVDCKEKLLVTILADFISGRLGHGVGSSPEERAVEILAFLGINDAAWIDRTCADIKEILNSYLDFLLVN